MTRSFRASGSSFARPAVALGVGGALVMLSLLATVLTFTAASQSVGQAPMNNPPLLSTTAQLAVSSGISRGFVIAAGFIGILDLHPLHRQHRRRIQSRHVADAAHATATRPPLLAGKLAALLVASSLALAAALTASVALSFALAAIRGISTAHWLSSAGAIELGRAYGNALLTVVLFAVLGASLGLIVRSTVPAVAIGIAWLMPIEHIVQGVWADAGRWFPGLVLDAITRDGTVATPYNRAILLGLLYTITLAAVGVTSFLRRDITT